MPKMWERNKEMALAKLNALKRKREE